MQWGFDIRDAIVERRTKKPRESQETSSEQRLLFKKASFAGILCIHP